MKIDKSDSQVVIDVLHHKVHHGLLNIVSDAGANVQIATPKYWQFKTPNTSKRIHFNFVGEASAVCKIEFYETPTLTDGTALSILNADRNIASPATLLAYKDPSVSVEGTLIAIMYIGSSGGSVRISGESKRDIEYILKQNTSYTAKFTVAANGTNVAVMADWYEV